MAQVECQQRRQRRGTAGGAGSTEERAAGRQVHVAGVLQVAERHPQPDQGPGFHGLGEEQKHKTEFSFEADHPEIFASEDLGATPVEFVLVGLASCLTAGVAAVAQNRGIQLRSVEAKLEGSMDIQGILGIDSDVRNGYDDIKVTFNIDADASKKEIEAHRRAVAEALGGVRRRHQPDQRDRRGRLSRRYDGRSGAAPSNTSRRSSSAPGTPGWRRAAASASARSITSCSSAARWPTPGAASAGTRCGC